MINGKGRPRNDRSDLVPFAPTACAHHYPDGKLPYLAWHDWAHRQTQKGKRQKQCPDCGRWLFAEEVGTKPETNVPQT